MNVYQWYKPESTDEDKLKEVALELGVPIVDDKKNPIDHATLCTHMNNKLAQGQKFNERMKYPELPSQLSLLKAQALIKTVPIESVPSKRVLPMKVPTLVPQNRSTAVSTDIVVKLEPTPSKVVSSATGVAGTLVAPTLQPVAGGGGRSRVMDDIAIEARRMAFEEHERLAAKVTANCQDATTGQAKKKLVTSHRIGYAKWLERKLIGLYEKYCKKYTDLTLIGSGKPDKLPYTLATCESLLHAAKIAIQVQVPIPAVTMDQVWFLNSAKRDRLTSLRYTLYSTYRAYYKFVCADRNTISEKDAELLMTECLEEFKSNESKGKFEMKKGVKDKNKKLITSFYSTLIFKASKPGAEKKGSPSAPPSPSASPSGSVSDDEVASSDEEPEEDSDEEQEDDDEDRPSSKSKKRKSSKIKASKSATVKLAKSSKPIKLKKSTKPIKSTKKKEDDDDDVGSDSD